MKMKRIRVMVTKRDVRDGRPGNWWLCPIAIALWPLMGRFLICVAGNSVVLYDGPLPGESVNLNRLRVVAEFGLPRSAERRLQRFDKRQQVKPFSFYAVVPVEVLNAR
jgi:hypothetical protein